MRVLLRRYWRFASFTSVNELSDALHCYGYFSLWCQLRKRYVKPRINESSSPKSCQLTTETSLAWWALTDQAHGTGLTQISCCISATECACSRSEVLGPLITNSTGCFSVVGRFIDLNFAVRQPCSLKSAKNPRIYSILSVAVEFLNHSCFYETS